jgi:DNA-binding NarL/FixJ family response regulator
MTAAVRVLLCDSHSIFAESLAFVLSEAGYEVVAATDSAQEMLEILRQGSVDVCLLDSSCAPESILVELAALRAECRVEVVLLSGHRDPQVLSAAAAQGVRAFAFKDQHVADVVDTIARVHGGEAVDPRSRPARGPADRAEPPEPVGPPEPRGTAVGADLTSRERDVLCHLARGADTDSVARSLGITLETARSHIRNVLRKLGAHSRVEAAAAAVRRGLVDAESGEWLQP